MFVIWSVTSFVLEVPSGAWADLVDRRSLLVLSGPIYAAGFAVWIVWPSYPGFALGFVLWGLSSALMSGTFEALVYDELAERGATDAYAGLLGLANAAATAASVAAIAVAAPLLAWGGFAAVGWVSVGVAVVHGTLATLLPAAPRSASADATRDGPAADAACLTIRDPLRRHLARRSPGGDQPSPGSPPRRHHCGALRLDGLRRVLPFGRPGDRGDDDARSSCSSP